ncbi:hypothetical protein B0H11DRAFT_2235267 [Mycena galericulata]|nr:hypothetical protein B0H11DRAFT_2235267 [Mycena galericulata]
MGWRRHALSINHLTAVRALAPAAAPPRARHPRRCPSPAASSSATAEAAAPVTPFRVTGFLNHFMLCARSRPPSRRRPRAPPLLRVTCCILPSDGRGRHSRHSSQTLHNHVTTACARARPRARRRPPPPLLPVATRCCLQHSSKHLSRPLPPHRRPSAALATSVQPPPSPSCCTHPVFPPTSLLIWFILPPALFDNSF